MRLPYLVIAQFLLLRSQSAQAQGTHQQRCCNTLLCSFFRYPFTSSSINWKHSAWTLYCGGGLLACLRQTICLATNIPPNNSIKKDVAGCEVLRWHRSTSRQRHNNKILYWFSEKACRYASQKTLFFFFLFFASHQSCLFLWVLVNTGNTMHSIVMYNVF